MDMQRQHELADSALAAASRIVDDAWDELRSGSYVQLQLGEMPARLPDLSFAASQRRSAVGQSLLQRLEGVDSTVLPHDLALTLAVVRFQASKWALAADWYWTVIDSLG